MLSDSNKEFVAWLGGSLPGFLDSLKVKDSPGRFLPCLKGATGLGREIGLGFSCLALKTFHTLGLWEGLDPAERKGWIDFIRSYQVNGMYKGEPVTANAFIDPPEMDYLAKQVTLRQRLSRRLFPPREMNHYQRTVHAETKQAIATLAQVGERAHNRYRGFPTTAEKVVEHCERLDWTKPWGAGAHAATLAVFLAVEGPGVIGAEASARLLGVCGGFIDSVADPETGSYFMGSRPEYYQLVNGAMKVLTALDWLGSPVHYPERLIDACLDRLPDPEGCHLVDAVYILYRCSLETGYRRKDIRDYCLTVLSMMEKHKRPDGGLSYFTDKSQTGYYGVPISNGLDEGDIHGTCLLTWGAAMILELLDANEPGFKIIRP